MHIKQIIVEGFKTYKNRVEVEEFSPHVNAVLGKNGSGKSNLLDAIAFVLSDKYSRSGQSIGQSEDPKSVVYHHENATGSKIIAASVELVLDNSDSRLPIDRSIVRIKRTVGTKKDEYFIDDANKSYSEVVSLLEAAGLSRSNPYNIVQQGRINELIRMSNSKRLSLLKEIAGTRTYDEKRAASLKIMKDTDVRRQDIKEVIDYLDGRLAELETERSELKEYEALDSQRRAIEFSIYEREREAASNKLAELEAMIEARRGASTTMHDALSKAETEREAKETEAREVERKLKKENAEKKSLQAKRREAINKEKEQEMLVREANERVKKEEEKHANSETELQALQAEIDSKDGDLSRMTREFERLLREETELKHTLNAAKQQRDSIYAKQSRKSQFTTKRQRDQYLTEKKREIEQTRKTEQAKLDEIQRSIETTRTHIEELKAAGEKVTNEIATLKQRLESNSDKLTDLKGRRESVNNDRKDRQRALSELSSDDADALDKAERRISSLVDSDTWRGIASVKKYAQAHPEVAHKIHGVVLDLFTCRSEFTRALESVVGSSLFHFVVEDDAIAATLIAHLASTDRSGRVTFTPLSQMRSSSGTQLPSTGDALPLLNRIEYDKRFAPVMQSLFGRVLLCRNLETASSMSHTFNVTAVTLDGNKVERKGALTGGFIDGNKSRIAVYTEYKRVADRISTGQAQRATLNSELSTLDASLRTILMEQHALEEDNKAIRREFDRLSASRKSSSSEVDHDTEVMLRQQRSAGLIQEALSLHESELARLTSELNSDFTAELSASEKRELDQALKTIETSEASLSELTKRRADAESTRGQTHAQLTENLHRRRDELVVIVSGLTLSEVRAALTHATDELSLLTAARKELDEEITRLDASIETLLARTKALSSEVEAARSNESESRERYHSSTNDMEKILAARLKHTTKKDESTRKIRELGSVSLSGVEERLQSKTSKQLLAMAEDINRSLLRFQHVNKKAIDQYLSFTEQRQDLLDRATELDASRQSINQLISHLDAKKDEAIQRTFKQIGQNFSVVFRELVPGGEGTLVIETSASNEEPDEETEVERGERKRLERQEAALRRGSQRKGRASSKRKRDEEAAEEEDADGPVYASRSYTGVGIKVRFPGAATDTHQLSGGQESVVALSLIFAIQRCDPSPFYVFDEIDSALDPVHRAAVAQLIDRQRSYAQFIVTSFSRELIQHADRFYGVIYQNKTSKVDVIEKDQALELVAIQEQSGGQEEDQ